MFEKLIRKWRELDRIEKIMVVYVAVLICYIVYEIGESLTSKAGRKFFEKGYNAGKIDLFDQLADRGFVTKKLVEGGEN